MTKLLHADITDKAWRAYYTVYNAHGHDYPEAFYEEMMRLEFEALGVPYTTQQQYEICYNGVKVGHHVTDTELAGCVILEYKVVPALLPRHYAQLVSYLKVSGKPVGLLFNFGGVKPRGARRVLTDAGSSNQPYWHPDDTTAAPMYSRLINLLRRVVWNVYHTLGAGFVFRVYANATYVELKQQGIVRHQLIIHRGYEIGEVSLRHFIVEERVVLLPVAESAITQSHRNKVRTIMQQAHLSLGMIVNFGNEKLEIRYVQLN